VVYPGAGRGLQIRRIPEHVQASLPDRNEAPSWAAKNIWVLSPTALVGTAVVMDSM
jgi:hypothetical protein